MRLKTEVILLLAVSVAASSCSHINLNPAMAAGGDRFYAVATESAAFYRYGPQQGNGPDKQLNKGTLMHLIRPSFGYCKVKLKDGEEGYIAGEDIGIASSALIAAANTPPRSSTAHLRLDADPQALGPVDNAYPDFLPTPIPEPTPGN